jgi:outer membrane protein assembly factor BamB
MVYSVDLKSGEIKWKIPVDGEVHATPVLFHHALWVGTNTGHLYQIDYKTGKIFQDKIYSGSPIEATPLPYKGNLLVAAGNTLHYVNVNTLEDIWNYNAGGLINASPATHNIPNKDGADPAIFIATMSNRVIALKNDGSQLWQFSPGGGQAFYSSPCVVNDSFLYIGNDNGKIYAVNTQDGSQKWAFATQGMVRSSPIQIGGNVLVGSNDRNFYSVDSATGLLRWKVLVSDQIVSSPAVANQYVYFGSFNGNMYKVDIIDGQIKWQRQSFGLIKASPTIYKGSVFIGSFDKNLYKLDTADGGEQWVRNIQGQMQASAIVDSIGGAAVPSISGDYKY